MSNVEQTGPHTNIDRLLFDVYRQAMENKSTRRSTYFVDRHGRLPRTHRVDTVDRLSRSTVSTQ